MNDDPKPKKQKQKSQEPQDKAPPEAKAEAIAETAASPPELPEVPPPIPGEAEHVKNAVLRMFMGVQQAAATRRLPGLPTGLVRIDEMTSGLHGGDVIVIGGRPGTGKTALALNIAMSAMWSAKVPVAFFSLESRREALAARLLCSEAKVDNGRLRSGMLSRDDWSRLAGAAGPLTELPLFVEDSLTTLSQITKEISRLRAEWGLGLVVIDYVQLMRLDERPQNREEEVAEISRCLKALSKELDVPIVVLSQLNRGLENRPGRDRRPKLSDLRDSGALEDDADLVLFVYRPEMYVSDQERATLRGLAEVIVAKQRTGATGIVRCRFFHEFSRFENLAEGEFDDYLDDDL